MHHSKGHANHINIKIENVDKDDVLYLDASPVSTTDPSEKITKTNTNVKWNFQENALENLMEKAQRPL
ncbi:hypothetical protein [Desulfosporosinus shakirovi]|uniref:hypothetical protein n=1 Tax=Desulfosporosinus shakirovi TaxID=2885154 RepID=UPI0037BE30BB|nr:hypothetical protein [Desulfosporosinus sp. SRJS8]